MLNCPDLDPAIANAAYMEFRASAGWLFDETSEEMFARGRYALAAIEDLRPATALEARVAAQAIASDVHAADCLRLAAEYRDDLAKVTRCRAQANAMTRQMDRALRTLTTLRKERGAREAWKVAFEMPREPWPKRASAADPAPRPASWAGRASVANPLLEPASLAGPLAGQASAANPMPEPASLVDPLAGRVSPADPLPEPASAADPALESAYAVDPAREPANGANNPVLPAAPTKAEQFAARNPLLASRIRAAGGLTRKAIAGFRPSSLPDDATVEALVYGAGPVVATMDRANGTVG